MLRRWESFQKLPFGNRLFDLVILMLLMFGIERMRP